MNTAPTDTAMPYETGASQERRVLMVCAAFPPTGGSGVQRSAKFAKYLPRFGWRPIVWSKRRINGLPDDPTLLDELRENVAMYTLAADGRTDWWRRAGAMPGSLDARLPRLAAAVNWRIESWCARRPWPDEFADWATASVDPLIKLIESEGVDAIYSTFSPVSNHVLAMRLHQRTGVPWVADFRDLWTDDFRYRETSKRRRRADRDLEQEILETAGAVIGVTPSQSRLLADRVAGQQQEFLTITNGFDPDDFADDVSDGPRDPSTFTLAFVGRFERYRAGAELLAGLGRIASSIEPDDRRFAFRVVGHVDRQTRSALREAGIDHTLTGYVSHAEAVREMRRADALLLSTEAALPNAETVICAKVFEYLAAERPILVVGPQGGECERIVRACDAGLAVPPDEDAVCEALRHLFDAWVAGRPVPGCDPAKRQRYSRIVLTRNLSTVLDRLVGVESRDVKARVARRAIAPAEVAAV